MTMKRLLFTMLAVTVLGIAARAQAVIEFTEPKSHDFGIIAENGGPVSHEFEFTNTGDKPLVIISATASCGCTRPKYPQQPVKPGQKAKIKVTYLPAGRPGEFSKTVKVKTNAPKQKRVNLKITGTVTP